MTLKDVVALFPFVYLYQKIHLKKPATSDLMPVDFVTHTVPAPKYIIELNPIGNVKIWCAESYMHCACLISHSVFVGWI